MGSSGGRLLRLNDLSSFGDEFNLFFVLEYKLLSSTAIVVDSLESRNRAPRSQAQRQPEPPPAPAPQSGGSHAWPYTCLGSLTSWWAWA